MKRTHLLAVAFFASIAVAAHAQELQTIYSVRDRQSSEVVSTPIATLHNVLKIPNFDLTIRGFGGYTITAEGKFTGGLALTYRVDIAKEVAADIGIYGRATANQPTDVGIFFGLTFKLATG